MLVDLLPVVKGVLRHHLLLAEDHPQVSVGLLMTQKVVIPPGSEMEIMVKQESANIQEHGLSRAIYLWSPWSDSGPRFGMS